MPLGPWVRAVRAPFYSATIVPVVLGTVIAYYQTGTFNPGDFLLTLAGMLLIHTGINLANDYFDHKSGNDEANSTLTPFSGGSRVIQDGLIAAPNILIASTIAFAVGGAFGLYLIHPTWDHDSGARSRRSFHRILLHGPAL